ncbi:MAG: sugar phosphate isomerase/epimerase [Chloroflexi bacterium]|nr:sugar phosphate isomerase/epimerase [Chloroflexota bacterium]
MSSVPVALQLYTVRDETARDFVGTLERVAALGYPAVEFAGYGGLDSGELKALLERTGLTAASTHVGLDALEADAAREIAYCVAIGCKHLVLPWLPPERREPSGLANLAALLNRLGRQSRDAGISFSYHNHDFEFEVVDGGYYLDRLLDETDPEAVGLELDVYWAAFAGVDPLTFMQRRQDRVWLVHIKDMGPDRKYTEVGDGSLDMAGIAAAAGAGGVQWLIVEHDKPTMPTLASASRSLENVQRLGLGDTSRRA